MTRIYVFGGLAGLLLTASAAAAILSHVGASRSATPVIAMPIAGQAQSPDADTNAGLAALGGAVLPSGTGAARWADAAARATTAPTPAYVPRSSTRPSPAGTAPAASDWGKWSQGLSSYGDPQAGTGMAGGGGAGSGVLGGNGTGDSGGWGGGLAMASPLLGGGAWSAPNTTSGSGGSGGSSGSSSPTGAGPASTSPATAPGATGSGPATTPVVAGSGPVTTPVVAGDSPAPPPGNAPPQTPPTTPPTGRSPSRPFTPTGGPTSGPYTLAVNGCISSACDSNGWEFFDPLIAIGYDYRLAPTTPGDALTFGITQIQVSTIVGDGIYQLYLCNATDTMCDFATDITGNGGNTTADIFDVNAYLASLSPDSNELAQLGITNIDNGIFGFELRGIDPAAALDPANPTAFVTGLLFAGDVNGSLIITPETFVTNIGDGGSLIVTPEVVDPPGPSPVPEPPSWLGFLTGFALLFPTLRARLARA